MDKKKENTQHEGNAIQEATVIVDENTLTEEESLVKELCRRCSTEIAAMRKRSTTYLALIILLEVLQQDHFLLILPSFFRKRIFSTCAEGCASCRV